MLRPDETWHRLRAWTAVSAAAERLAAQTLYAAGFKDVDPAHPLGGPDGGKDALAIKDDERWVMAVYFPREQKSFTEIEAKFLADFRGVAKNGVKEMAFATNQEMRESERRDLTSSDRLG